MKRILTPLAMLALGACKTAHIADFIATPADRLVCEAAGARPKIEAEPTIDWQHITTVAQAKIAHDDFVKVVHDREGVVAAYLLSIESNLYVCKANMDWRKDWEAELAKSHAGVRP